jgi:hypothetical protein
MRFLRFSQTIMMLVVALLFLVFSGCNRQQGNVGNPTAIREGSAQAAQTPQNQSKPKTVVVGLDKTGSYDIAKAGREQTARLLFSSACQCDVWYFRWIERNSYNDSASIFTLRLPEIPSKPDNPFDRRALAAWQAKMASINSLKRQAAQRLVDLRPEPDSSTRMTDVWGFLAKALELLANVPDGREKVIVMASDLEDNMGRRVPLNLKEVRVVVLALQSGNEPAKAQRKKEFWAKVFKDSEALNVRFLDPSESPEDALSFGSPSLSHR